jgi:hypothetical protein
MQEKAELTNTNTNQESWLTQVLLMKVKNLKLCDGWIKFPEWMKLWWMVEELERKVSIGSKAAKNTRSHDKTIVRTCFARYRTQGIKLTNHPNHSERYWYERSSKLFEYLLLILHIKVCRDVLLVDAGARSHSHCYRCWQFAGRHPPADCRPRTSSSSTRQPISIHA